MLPVVVIVLLPAAIIPIMLPAVMLPVPVITPEPNPKLPTLAFPVTLSVAILAVPPTNKVPPIPTPPATLSAPDVVDVDVVVVSICTIPAATCTAYAFVNVTLLPAIGAPATYRVDALVAVTAILLAAIVGLLITLI